MRARLKQWYFSKGITSRTIIAVTATLTFTIILATTSLVAVFHRSFADQAKINAEKDSQLIADKLDMFFDSVKSDAVYLVTGEWCQRLYISHPDFVSIGSNTSYMLYRELQNVTYQRLMQDARYEHVVLYDMNGTGILFGDDECSQQNLELQKEQVRAFMDGTAVEALVYLHQSPWKEPYSSGYTQCISYLRKVYNMETGKLLGAVEFEIDYRRLAQLYQTVLQNQSQVIILSDDGVVQIASVETDDQALARSGVWMKKDVVVADDGLYAVSISKDFSLHVINQVPNEVYLGGFMHYLLVAVVIGIVALLFSLWLCRILIRSITKPLNKIIACIMNIGEKNMDSRISVLDGGEIGRLASQFNKMLERTQNLMDSIVEKEQKKRETELALIQMRMTPHFFYNVLESICGLIVTDDKQQAIQVINLLAVFYRGLLSRGQEIVTIEEELSISDAYIRIMQICYPNKFTYRARCDEASKTSRINKLTLQPLLENAIHHGFSQIETGGEITVDVSARDNRVVVDIADNGCGLCDAYHPGVLPDNRQHIHTESYGLYNTNERIQMYFGTDFGITFVPSARGTTARIVLPLTREATRSDP